MDMNIGRNQKVLLVSADINIQEKKNVRESVLKVGQTTPNLYTKVKENPVSDIHIGALEVRVHTPRTFNILPVHVHVADGNNMEVIAENLAT